MKKFILAVVVTGLLLLIISNVTKASNTVELQRVDLKTKTQEIEIKTQKSLELQKQLENAHGDLEKLKSIEQENKKLQDEISRLQAIKAEKARIAEVERKSLAERALNKATGTQTVHAQSGNFYKDYIYRMESGNRTTAINSIGCRGLGQACPGTKLPCGDDYACQDAYFTNYAMQRYGSWEQAYNFWIAHRWW